MICVRTRQEGGWKEKPEHINYLLKTNCEWKYAK